MRGYARVIDAIVLIATPLSLIVCALLRFKASALLTFAVGIASISIFFLGWERSHPPIEKLMPVVVLSSLSACGRIVFAAIPNVQPVSAICVCAGCILGPRSGFMVGSLSALVSNCFLGQGPWTPWQMYAWGLIGYLAGIIFYRRISVTEPMRFQICAYGFVASFIYGAIMDTWTLVGFTHGITVASAVAVYGAGAIFNFAHAMSTVAFLLALFVPWARKLIRYREKLASQIVSNENTVFKK